MSKKSNTDESLYIWGEIAGKTCVFLTKVEIVIFGIGLVCELIRDVRARKAQKKLINLNI